MKKLLTILAALAILASGTANAQVAERLTAHRLDRPWTFSSFVAPTGCVSSSVPFFGASVTLGCDGGLTYDSTGRALTTETVKATSYAAQAKTVTITGATNATPIVVTATAHGLYTGDLISISGITGNTNANGFFKVTRLTADTFSLQNYSTGADIAGNGAYGGSPAAITGIVQAERFVTVTGSAQFGVGTSAGTVISNTATRGIISSAADGSAYRGFLGQEFAVASGGTVAWSSTAAPSGTIDTILTRAAAATLQLGAANAASPVAQTLKFQDATGTNANAAATFTVNGPAGTGTGTPGDIVFKAPIGASNGSTAHTQTEALRIKGAASGGVPVVVLSATQSPASNAACTAGTITWDASYIYICTASGAWKRAALTGGY